PERLAGSDDVGEQPVELTVPDLAPRVASGASERVRMLDAEDGPVGVVVEDGEIRTPEEADLRFGRQQHADGAAQALRPLAWGAERRPCPVHGAHVRAHFAAAGEEFELRKTHAAAFRTGAAISLHAATRKLAQPFGVCAGATCTDTRKSP